MPHGPDFTKAPPELAVRFSATVSALPGAQVRQMFGYPAGFVNGNLFTGIYASSWFVRLPDDEHQLQRLALNMGYGQDAAGEQQRPQAVLDFFQD